MYNCEEILRLLYPYIDGELDVKESLKVQEHLRQCDFCLALYKEEKDFVRSIKPSVTLPPVPRQLRERISAQLATVKTGSVGSPPRPRKSRVLFPVGVALVTLATVIAVLAGGWFYEMARNQGTGHVAVNKDPSTVLLMAAVKVLEDLIKGNIHFDIVSADPAVILNFLKAGLDFPVGLPADQLSDMRPVGGKMFVAGQRTAAIVVFESGETRLSLVIAHPQRFQDVQKAPGPINVKAMIPFEGKEKSLNFYPFDYRGFTLLGWTAHRVSYILISDRKEAVAHACRVCHGDDAVYNEFVGNQDRI